LSNLHWRTHHLYGAICQLYK